MPAGSSWLPGPDRRAGRGGRAAARLPCLSPLLDAVQDIPGGASLTLILNL